jgi:hypothetical protein
MKWATREKLGFNRPACIWLIRRFVDEEAEIVLLPSDGFLEKAAELGAVTFHAPGADYHIDGVSKTTFDQILEGRDLAGKDPALDILAEILNDGSFRFRLGRPTRHPEAAGVWSVNQGYRVSHPEDDARLEALMGFYDALYSWCQRRVREGLPAGAATT